MCPRDESTDATHSVLFAERDTKSAVPERLLLDLAVEFVDRHVPWLRPHQFARVDAIRIKAEALTQVTHHLQRRAVGGLDVLGAEA